jgi:hypothetical protein
MSQVSQGGREGEQGFHLMSDRLTGMGSRLDRKIGSGKPSRYPTKPHQALDSFFDKAKKKKKKKKEEKKAKSDSTSYWRFL